MPSIRALRAKLTSLRTWAARAMLRPDAIILVQLSGGTAEIGDTARPHDLTG